MASPREKEEVLLIHILCHAKSGKAEEKDAEYGHPGQRQAHGGIVIFMHR